MRKNVLAARTFKIGEVFTPNDTPDISYVGRDDLRLEEDMGDFLALPKMVLSISGPSKSGKTVLIKKVLSEDNIIPVIGSGISSADDLWSRALAWMEVPTKLTASSSSTSQYGGSMAGGGEIGIPLVAKGKATGTMSGSQSSSNSSSETFEEAGVARIIKEISGSDFVIFIDDFHYIREEIREEVGRQVKVAADNGVKVVTASVPHRSDDVVRSNPELRGRVAAVDLGYWEPRHLQMIANKGFAALNCELAPAIATRLSIEAMGSPQLMQTICFNLCQALGLTETIKVQSRIDVSEDQIKSALKQTSRFTDFSKMLTSLHSGPRTRGQERKVHQFTDSSQGDVYRAVLMAMKADPVRMSFSYDDVLARVKSVCEGEAPVGSSINSCLEQMHIISENVQPGRPVLAWDGDNLDVADPYFAFFLRSSEKLTTIA